MPKLPFVHTPKLRHTAIGSEEFGVLWLIEKGGISPKENPVDIQDEILKQQKATTIYKSATAKLAKARGISLSEARKLMEGMDIKQADGETTIEIDNDPVRWDDWMTPEEVAELIMLSNNTQAIELKVATLFIQHRVLYPVFLSSAGAANATTLEVKPLNFELVAGSKIDFESFKVEVTEYADEGATTIEVAKLPGKLKADAYGFLQDGPRKKAGCEWTEDDTRELDFRLIHDIYRLYCREMGMADPDATAEEIEESAPLDQKSLNASENSDQLNGKASSIDSASLELVTSA